MKPLNQALEHILSGVKAVNQTEQIPLMQACGRYLAQDIIAPINVPPADNSAMDGYAINSGDCATLTPIAISQTINAGAIPSPLLPGTAARIFTGAEIPANADMVVIQENCQAAEGTVTINADTDLGSGLNIRRCGQDIAKGKTLFNSGHRLTAVDIGVLASQGFAEVTVKRKVKVAIVSTGDELVEPGQPLGPGQIYNSNRYLLHSALTALGCDLLDLGRAPDNLPATKACFERGTGCDLIISTGGVSVGEADFVKEAVTQLGELTSWKLAIKPGKPLAFGRIKNTPFLGLPGNPVAVFVTFLLVVKAYIKTLNGNNTAVKTRPFITDFAIKKPSDRANYLRVKITNDGKITRFNNQSSGVLSSVAWADGLAIVPTNTTVENGQPLDVILLNDHLLN